MGKIALYPLKFDPIFKEKIWGGNKLASFLNKETNSAAKIGESWEISGVSGSISKVANGPLKGLSLTELCKSYKDELLGSSVYNQFEDEFPLLVKFIDASEDLSVQLHPNDEVAQKKHKSFGKAEMWYIIDAEEKSRIIYGFKNLNSLGEVKKLLSNEEIMNSLNEIEVSEGDSYYIEPGTVHAIGKGILLAEIQQSSDITYRIYDYNRKDAEGNTRELHTADAIESVKLNSIKKNEPKSLKEETLFETPYFVTNKIQLDNNIVEKSYSEIDSFVIFTIIDGSLTIMDKNLNEYSFNKGEAILIPNSIDTLKIESKTKATILETYLP